MQQTIIQNGSRAVVVTQQGNSFSARLYVGARNGLANASATLVSGAFKSLNGATRWAERQVAA